MADETNTVSRTHFVVYFFYSIALDNENQLHLALNASINNVITQLMLHYLSYISIKSWKEWRCFPNLEKITCVVMR